MQGSGKPLGGEPVFLKQGPRALLFIHGFTSTPESLMPVAESLARAGWTVQLPLLPGHGTTPEDMEKYSFQDWMEAVLAAWDGLSRSYERPAVAGLSMGAALALHVACRRPVSAVAALAPSLYIKDWRLSLLPLLRLVKHWNAAIANDIKGRELQETAYPRFALKNVADLLELQKIVRAELPGLRAPLLGIQSREDHTVPPSCLDDLMRWAGSEVKEQHRLLNSYHVITLDQERGTVAGLMDKFFSRCLSK